MSTTTVPTQIRIDADLKKNANVLFKELGMDMSTAVNIFLRQCVICEGIPFEIRKNNYSKELIAAMEEAEALAKNPKTKRYTFEEFEAEMDRWKDEE